MKKLRFDAELIQGHKGVMAVIVPFNPEVVFRQKPVRLDPRRDGWPVRGTANGAAFQGYIGNRWGRFFIMLDPDVIEAGRLSEGQLVTVEVQPALDASTVAKAREQSQITTAPKKGRADALVLDAQAPAKGKAKAKARKPAVRSPKAKR